jgi:squalene cyclase
VEAYRVSKFLEKMQTNIFFQENNIENAVRSASAYINVLQNKNGSWYEVSNKQGLSNVWSTAFIAMHLDPAQPEAKKAVNFLAKSRQKDLWGYNTEWLPDFDSTTCTLILMNATGNKSKQYVQKWLEGQQSSGGFSTYEKSSSELGSFLGINNINLLKGWTSPHVCVSALCFYFMAEIKDKELVKKNKEKLKAYLLKNMTKKYVWKPYWWTSVIYPTTLIVKALIIDNNETDQQLIYKIVSNLLSRQCKDGSFKCDVIKKKSVLYSAMILDMLCHSPVLFKKYASKIEILVKWLLTKQYENGSFEGTDFLVIPTTNTSLLQDANYNMKINRAGGTGSINGEIAGLFTTSVTLSALNKYNFLNKI